MNVFTNGCIYIYICVKSLVRIHMFCIPIDTYTDLFNFPYQNTHTNT
jgi:hypothetical protein